MAAQIQDYQQNTRVKNIWSGKMLVPKNVGPNKICQKKCVPQKMYAVKKWSRQKVGPEIFLLKSNLFKKNIF